MPMTRPPASAGRRWHRRSSGTWRRCCAVSKRCAPACRKSPAANAAISNNARTQSLARSVEERFRVLEEGHSEKIADAAGALVAGFFVELRRTLQRPSGIERHTRACSVAKLGLGGVEQTASDA